MRICSTALLFVALLGVAAGARAADPSPQTIPDLIAKVKDLRAKEADLKKQREQTETDLKAALKKQQDEIDNLFGPGPGPKPPDPKPPAPIDPLRAKLKAAYDADPVAADKRREQAKDLAELYRQAAKLAADESLATSGALLEQIGKAAATLLNDPPAPARKNLADVRKAVALELAALLPTDDALTGEQRKGVAELFAKLALIIEEIAK